MTRRFCSTSCRVKDWDRRNRPQAPDPRLDRLYAPTNPKHYHVRNGLQMLVGHRVNAPWFGDTCPPECPGLLEGEQYRPMEAFHAEVLPESPARTRLAPRRPNNLSPKGTPK